MRGLILLLALFAGPAIAADSVQPVYARKQPTTSLNLSSTIAVTDVFQRIAVQNFDRLSCTVQNTGANPMWVFFGPKASATKAGSVVLAVGQSVTCGTNGAMIADEINITGTATENFFASIS